MTDAGAHVIAVALGQIAAAIGKAVFLGWFFLFFKQMGGK